jgi:hypothetical protein
MIGTSLAIALVNAGRLAPGTRDGRAEPSAPDPRINDREHRLENLTNNLRALFAVKSRWDW